MSESKARELDALVAEKVMGKQTTNWRDELAFVDETGATIWGPDEYGQIILQVVPHYSTSIAAAWLVVEKFPQVAIYGPHDSWLVRFFDEDGVYINSVDDPGRAPTSPEAICLAALKAVAERI